MESYNIFAKYYDLLTRNAEHKVRSDYISGFFNANDKESFKVLDVACGTGKIAEYLKNDGYDVTGLDLSEDMLSIASSRLGTKIIKSDMRSFDFNNGFNAVICNLDSLNHLTEKDGWIGFFKSAYNSLSENGSLIFDVNTVYKHKYVLADNAFVFDEEDFFLSWDNEFLEDNTVRILLDFFVFNEKNYDRYSEEIFERAFEIDEIKEMLSPYFEVIGVYDDLTLETPKYDSERVYFICKRK